MNESLYFIEDTLQQLHDVRQQAEDDGDSEALKVIDQQIAAYLTKEAAKVTSYVGLIRTRENQAEACDREIERIQALKKAALADVVRLKQNALQTMQQFGVKELKATPGGGLRRQGNGGLQALDVPDLKNLPDDFKMVIVRTPLPLWREILHAIPREIFVKIAPVSEETHEENSRAIREALKQHIPCPECAQTGKAVPWEKDCDPCPRCNGQGTIPQTIPGVRLLERGEHVRVI